MKLVIVDRDGTICVDREGYIQTPDDWEPLPGALDAIARINQAGYHMVIAANLPLPLRFMPAFRLTKVWACAR